MVLHFRDGSAFNGKPSTGSTGKPYTMVARVCSRCGGAGRSDKWAYTGFTCYDCGGSGKGRNAVAKLYTVEELAKLNAARDKRHAKAQAKAAEIAAQRKVEADARRDAFEAAHGALMDKALRVCEGSDFVADVVRRARERCEISEGQIAALEKNIAKREEIAAIRAASRHVGNLGERLSLTVTVDRVIEIGGRDFCGRPVPLYISTMRDADNNVYVVKSGTFCPSEGSTFAMRGTVKSHGEYRGTAQTVLNRVKVA